MRIDYENSRQMHNASPYSLCLENIVTVACAYRVSIVIATIIAVTKTTGRNLQLCDPSHKKVLTIPKLAKKNMCFDFSNMQGKEYSDDLHLLYNRIIWKLILVTVYLLIYQGTTYTKYISVSMRHIDIRNLRQELILCMKPYEISLLNSSWRIPKKSLMHGNSSMKQIGKPIYHGSFHVKENLNENFQIFFFVSQRPWRKVSPNKCMLRNVIM